MYAAAAPMPTTVVNHLFQRFKASPGVSDAEKEKLFVSLVDEKRSATFTVLDPFVMAGELSRTWLMETLVIYGHPIAPRTFAYWQDKNLIETGRAGKIKPLSAQALLIAAMIDPGQRAFLPPTGVPVGDTWHCYIQRSPDADVESWPVGCLNELPPATLCWTPCASAYWGESGWRLVGEGEGDLGCMRFAGTRMDRGHIWYNVSVEEIRRWDADVAALYTPMPGNTLTPVQNLFRLLFDRLAVSRLGRKG